AVFNHGANQGFKRILRHVDKNLEKVTLGELKGFEWVFRAASLLANGDSYAAAQHIILSLRTFPLSYDRDIEQYRCQAEFTLDPAKYNTILANAQFLATFLMNPQAAILTLHSFLKNNNKLEVEDEGQAAISALRAIRNVYSAQPINLPGLPRDLHS